MILAFTLSMPSNNAWNGKWTGEGRLHVKVVPVLNGKKREAHADSILLRGHYRYSFGDGWVAAVHVKRVDGVEAKALRKRSAGFCGYEWMVDSIMRHGDIYADAPSPERKHD